MCYNKENLLSVRFDSVENQAVVKRIFKEVATYYVDDAAPPGHIKGTGHNVIIR